MATEAQINANRKNAQKSTGPKTPEGKEAVRLNGLKHGLASEILVLPGESESDFHNLLDSLEAEHEPATPTEVILVRQLAMDSWRLQRIFHMEAAYFHVRRRRLEEHFDQYYTHLTEPGRQAVIVERDSDTLTHMSRYETRLERSFHKSLTALQHLRAHRKSQMAVQSQSHPVPAKTPAARPANAPIPIRATPKSATVPTQAAPSPSPQPTTNNQQPTTASVPAPAAPSPGTFDL